MEEKKTERQEAQEEEYAMQFREALQNAAGGIADKMKTAFTLWRAEGLDAAGMFQRVSDAFERDPRGAEELFGGDYLDIVDYFTHYWY